MHMPADSCELLLVRHGHVRDNDYSSGARLCGWCDPPLSELGQRQGQFLQERFSGETLLAGLYTSPLCRAAQTAQLISEIIGLTPQVVEDLREINCGTLDGLPLEEVKLRYPNLWLQHLAQTDDEFCWPGGETYRSFRARVTETIDDIAAAHPGERVILVTHSGVITQIMGELEGMPPERWESHRAGNASITAFQWQRASRRLLWFDDRSHLRASISDACVGPSNDA